MAGYETVSHQSILNLVKNIVTRYQTLLKSKARNQPKANSDREAFLADLKTCLHVGKPGLRESLMMDRVRVNLGIASEDVGFLDDHFGPRLQAMSHKVDEEFAKRKAANQKRKSASEPQPGPSSANSPSNVDTGAAHKAHFMAFALCSLKNKCFSKKVDKRLVFEEETLRNLWRLGQYSVKFYVPQFLLASLGRDAPSNNLNLFQSLLQHREVDRELEDCTLDTLSRHRWYLAEHVIPFALFSNNVTEEEKRKMAEKLLTLERDSVPSLGLPEFPEVTESSELCDFVTSKTWQFFDIVKSDPSWLTKRVSDWEFDEDYNQVKYFVSTVKVVNDSCERAVAMATEYGNILTKDSVMRGKILQIVEHNRRNFPDCSKKTLGK